MMMETGETTTREGCLGSVLEDFPARVSSRTKSNAAEWSAAVAPLSSYRANGSALPFPFKIRPSPSRSLHHILRPSQNLFRHTNIFSPRREPIFVDSHRRTTSPAARQNTARVTGSRAAGVYFQTLWRVTTPRPLSSISGRPACILPSARVCTNLGAAKHTRPFKQL